MNLPILEFNNKIINKIKIDKNYWFSLTAAVIIIKYVF